MAARAAVALLSLVSASLLSVGLASAKAPQTLPQLGGATTPAAPSGGGTVDVDQLRRGVVQVEQGGRPMAVGTVLQKDGRILTSLSALGGVEQPEIRYSDNSVVKTKIGHKDKAWDLALLIPQSGKWVDGLMPTDADPSGLEIKAFLPKAGKLAASLIGLKGRMDARTKEGDPLRSALDLDFKGIPGIPGAPLLDPNGKVVGILVKACKDSPAAAAAAENKDKDKPAAADAKPAALPQCAPIVIGAPVIALRTFLMKTPQSAIQPPPWLGLGGAPTENGNVKGVRVMGVAPGSPAEKAGLKSAGDNPDTIVAVDGQPVETPDQLSEMIAKRAIGQTVKLLVFSSGKFREVAVPLRAAPN